MSETFLILRRIQRDIVINVYVSSCKVLVIRVIFKLNLNFIERFCKNPQISNFVKIRPMGAEVQVDRRTDERTDKMKLIVAFSNVAKAPKGTLKLGSVQCPERRSGSIAVYHYQKPSHGQVLR